MVDMKIFDMLELGFSLWSKPFERITHEVASAMTNYRYRLVTKLAGKGFFGSPT
jgi:hypothetical protein